MRTCTQCEKCCIKYSTGLGSATEEDYAIWEVERPDILVYTDSYLWYLWISPVTGEEMQRCPWLRKLPGKEK